MGNRSEAVARAVDESVELAEDKRGKVPVLRRASFLQCKEAVDLRWYFAASAAAIGIHGCNPAGGSGGGSPVESAEAKHVARRTSRHREAIARERRIARRLARLPAAVKYALDLAFTPRQFGNGVAAVTARIGELASLSLALPRARENYKAYIAAFVPSAKRSHPDTPAAWLVVECASTKTQRADKYKAEAEEVLKLAIEAYQALPPEEDDPTAVAPPSAPVEVTARRGSYVTVRKIAVLFAELLGLPKPPRKKPGPKPHATRVNLGFDEVAE